MTISEETFACQEMVMDINRSFADALRLTDADYFNWNCVQIVNVASFSHVTDEHLTGMVVNVSIGKESFGSSSIRGSLVTSDGGISANDAKEVIHCSPGCRPWVMLRFAQCCGEDNTDGFDREYLEMLRFVLQSEACQSAPADEKSFIHCCCEDGSLLSNPVKGARMKVVDVTKETFCTNQCTVNNVIRKLKGLGDIFLYCSPCTGGSAW